MDPGSGLPDPYGLAQEALAEGRVLAPIIALEGLAGQYLDSPLRSHYLQALGCFYSFAGDYARALECFDELEGPATERPVDLSGLEPAPALAAVSRAAEDRRAVFLNEAHHVPRHRAFTLLTLRELRRRGFSYFAAEGINEPQEALVARGYPAWSTGYYFKEPLYGELVREALRLGFKVVAYESSPPDERPAGAGPYHVANLREEGQARNLKERILDKDPAAKLVVHAGYGHIQKRSPDAWHPMAMSFQELTGIEPLCVDQTELCEQSDPRFERPRYRAALERFAFSEPTVLRSKGGVLWSDPGLGGIYDAQVLHPRGRCGNGRPDWLLLGGERRWTPVPPELRPSFPCLVQAFYSSEGEESVPADQLMLRSSAAPAVLALRPGRYRLRTLGVDGNVMASSALDV